MLRSTGDGALQSSGQQPSGSQSLQTLLAAITKQAPHLDFCGYFFLCFVIVFAVDAKVAAALNIKSVVLIR